MRLFMGVAAMAITSAAMGATGVEEYQLELKTGSPKVSDRWLHAAETSAVVYWKTDMPAETVVEYGPDEKCELATEPIGKSPTSGKPFFTHLHRLRGLDTGRTYHYRLVSKSPGGKTVRGPVRSFETKKIDGAIRIPGDVKGPPYVLDKAGATYVLTGDIAAPMLAIDVKAGGITLELDGHTVTYNDENKQVDTKSYNTHVKTGAFGIRVRGADKDVKLLNGVIRQGKGNNQGSYTTIGYNPVYASGCPGLEIAGLTCEWTGTQVSGIILHWGGVNADVHHNVIHDMGKLIADRHQTVSALKGLQQGGKARHNLVRRSRQCGIMVGKGAEVHHNEVHIDSYSINSFAFGMKDGTKNHDNMVFGGGSNCVAFGTTGGCDGVEVYDNYARLYGSDIKDRWADLNQKAMESSRQSVMSGPRVTWGCKSVDYHDNTIIVTGKGGSRIRGTFFYSEAKARGVKFRNNVVAAIDLDGTIELSGAIATVGNHKADAAPVLYENNLVISNFANVNFGDSYGTGMNCRFVGNTFRRVGERDNYATVRKLNGYASTGHVFIDSKFEGGAGYDKVNIRGSDEIKVGWTLTVRTAPGTDVVVKDKAGTEVFKGKAGDDGTAKAECIQYVLKGTEKTAMTPHTVTVGSGDGAKSKAVEVTAVTEMSLKP